MLSANDGMLCWGEYMVTETITRPHCGSNEIVKNGFTPNAQEREVSLAPPPCASAGIERYRTRRSRVFTHLGAGQRREAAGSFSSLHTSKNGAQIEYKSNVAISSLRDNCVIVTFEEEYEARFNERKMEHTVTIEGGEALAKRHMGSTKCI